MAKVKIQGHASGTGILTVTAPNTSTDRTITLPDATGTLLNSDGDGSSLTGITHTDATKLPLAGGTMTGDLIINQTVADSAAIDYLVDIAGDRTTNAVAGQGVGLRFKIPSWKDSLTTYIGAGIGAVRENSSDDDVSTALTFSTSQNDATLDEFMRITSDGRGLSQFTAKAWANLNGEGTIALRDSHNISSVTDNTTGDYTFSFSNNMANTGYSTVMMGEEDGTTGYKNFYVDRDAGYDVGAVRVQTINNSDTYVDSMYANLIIFGD